jgi:hypothetical protein
MGVRYSQAFERRSGFLPRQVVGGFRRRESMKAGNSPGLLIETI